MWELFEDYWELGLLLATWSGLAVLGVRRRLDWRRNRFTEQVNFSLSYLETDPEGRRVLRLRTLLEDSARNVWLNEYGVRQVQKAAAATTPEQPFLQTGPGGDPGLVNHAVLNVLAERYSEAPLARAMGVGVRTARFLFGLTWERYDDLRTHKLRVMVVRPEELEALFGPGGCSADVAVERESHRRRLQTLETLYRLWRSDDPAERSMIGEVELGIVLDRADS